MALSGTRLTTNLDADYFTQLQTIFPIPSGLLPSEQSGLTACLHKIASALANAGGPDIVNEITGNAKVPFPIPVAVSTGTGIGGTTAEGTVT